MKNGYKLGLAAIVASLFLVGCGSDSDSTSTATADTTSTTTPATTDTTSTAITLEEFVSGKTLSLSGEEGSAKATFASDGYYEENYGDGGFCNGNWAILDATTINVTCADEGQTPTAADASVLDFVGELETGMTIIFGDMQVTVTNVETAVNPDA